MENQITIREAVTESDVAIFWEQLHIYHKRDIFPDPESEDLEYFLGSEYYDHMMKIHSRPQDRCYFLFFHRDGQDIGFAMPVIFTSEDGKCFIMEFCVYPEFRVTAQAKNVPGCFWAGQRKTARCTRSLTTAATSGGDTSGKLSALSRTVLMSGANR